MKKVNAILISPADNCVTLSSPADAGDIICYSESSPEASITAIGHIPIWHKAAIKPIDAGAEVLKYGCVIGVAFTQIKTGEHVHVHNIRSHGIGE